MRQPNLRTHVKAKAFEELSRHVNRRSRLVVQRAVVHTIRTVVHVQTREQVEEEVDGEAS